MENINKLKTREIAITGLLIALLSVSGYIVFPIPFTPIMITAQTIIINIIALTLKPRNAVMAILSFLMIGAMGIPVFSGGNAGIGAIIGPTGGYLVGFVISVFCISWFRVNEINIKKYMLLTIVVGMPIIYFFGVTWMSLYSGNTIVDTLKVAVIPFIVGDIIKAVIASLLAVRINKIK